MLTMTGRSFNQDTGRAKKAASDGPVVITDRGRPSHVLLTYQAYRRLLDKEPSIGELMYVPGVADIELEIPPRDGDLSREADFS